MNSNINLKTPTTAFKHKQKDLIENLKISGVDTIVFYNSFHRGDLFTNREFIRSFMEQQPLIQYNYLTDNPEKLLREFKFNYVGGTRELSKSPVGVISSIPKSKTLVLNTHVGAQWGIFCEEGGVNMNTFFRSWQQIAKAYNKITGSNVVFDKPREEYLPRVDYEFCQKNHVDQFVEKTKGKFKILICNNVPFSNQSFKGDMSEFIEPLAKDNPDIMFLLTTRTRLNCENIFYTDDITGINDDCDLLEISYLSTFCNVVIGKNSGPYVFCETYDNLMDSKKTFFSFNKYNKEYINRDTIKETMSYDLSLKCSYNVVGLEVDSSYKDDLSRKDYFSIQRTLQRAVDLYEKA